MAENKDHYSYSEYARKDVAEQFETLRFGGPVGQLMRSMQEDQLRRWIAEPAGKNILDIGAGTGRTSIPLAKAGAKVTAADASATMLAVAERNAAEAGVELNFDTCDIMNLPFADREFDLVLCFRVLLHVTDWRRAFAEICRSAKSEIIMDFPPRWSLASLQVPVRAFRYIFNKSVQKFRLFSLRQIRREFARHGFEISHVEKLWVLPIAFHKVFKSRGFTQSVEKILAAIGLRYLFGAPVTVRARRINDSRREKK